MPAIRTLNRKERSMTLARDLLLCLALLPTSAAAAVSCVVFPAGATPVQVVTPTGSLAAPVRLADCSQARLRGGSALVCFTRATGRRDCRTLAAGRAVDARALGAVERELRDWSFADLLAMLGGDEQVRHGMTRGPGEKAALPAGPVLAPASLVPWPLRDVTLSFPMELEVRSGRQEAPVLRLTLRNAADAARIDPAAFDPGATYEWRLANAAGTQSGTFSLLSEEARADMEAELAAIAAEADSAGARRVLEAEALGDAGLVLDRARRLAQP